MPRTRPDVPSRSDPLARLGAARPHWESFLARVRAEMPEVEITWKTYAGSSGRQCVLRVKGRNLAYLKPAADGFLVSVALSDETVARLADAKLPKALVREIESSPRYPEGRAGRVQVDSGATLRTAIKLLALKAAHVLGRTSSSDPPATRPAKNPVARRTASGSRSVSRSTRAVSADRAKPRLLSGDNPQIAKAEGEAPVQAYIAAIPGWKRDIAQQLDALITRTLPQVRKAVKWNSPLYAVGDQEERASSAVARPAARPAMVGSWFLSFHCYSKFVKVAFFRGAHLSPPPPGKSKQKDVRYLDIREHDWGASFDEAQLADWVRQAAALPGERM